MGFTRILDILLQRTISGQQVNCFYPYEHLPKDGIENLQFIWAGKEPHPDTHAH